MAACLVRVPTEIIKQRAQAGSSNSLSTIAKKIYKTNGFMGFYRGYATTITREIPFSFIELPLWEFMKKKFAIYKVKYYFTLYIFIA